LENGDTAKDSFDTSRAESNNLSSATEKSRFSVTYWDRPIVAWAAGVTAVGCRDTVQRLLLGRPGALGTGMIPKEAILDTVSSRGVPDLFDHVKVRHSSGGVSLIYFKSYEQGREKWQGETVDIIWFDEEPPLDIYIEGLTRTNATGGHVFVTFTPLMGMSDVVARFLMEKSPDRSVTQMTIDDVLHYTQEQKQRIIESYPIHEREARTKGVPIMGSGRVFPVSEEQITTDPFEIPEYWAKLGGMDFGWDHPFAAIEMVHDREEDVVYVTKCFRAKEQTPVLHASALRHWGPIPWAWPHDGYQHDKGSGKSLADQYRSEGLDMYHENARFPDGGFGVEAGISLMLTRMQTGRFKVFKHLNEWFEEFRLYHRKDGMIVKERDDLMAATRYALMMLRIATAVQELPRQEKYLSKTIKRLGTWMSR
jgi:phage terminase large subunit-like protein